MLTRPTSRSSSSARTRRAKIFPITINGRVEHGAAVSPALTLTCNTVPEIGARIVIPLADRYYGLRDFTIADPDGFGIRFASALPGR